MDDETSQIPLAEGEPETPAEPEAEPREPLALETALTWLAKIRPAAVLALLREPDFALVSVSAFAGFRVDKTGYANPLVRRRLAQEAVRQDKFGDKLRALAEDAAPIVASVPSPTPQPIVAKDKDDAARHDVLRADRDRRRRERDEARQALVETQTARGEAEVALRHAEGERDEAARLAQRQAQRIERLERQVTRLQTEQAGLLRALKQPPFGRESGRSKEKREEGQGDAAPVSLRPEAPSPWRDAVAHLLDKRKYDLALGLAEDVLRADADEAGALDIAARSHEGRGEPRLAVPLLRHLLTARLSQGDITQAGEALLKLLQFAASPTETERDVRAFLAVLRPDNGAAIAQTRGVLARLRGLAPQTFDALATQIRALAAPELAESLMPTPGLPGPDDPLPLPMPFPLTARQLLQAIGAGDVARVEEARAALARVCDTDPAAQTRARQALERAAGEDDSALTALFGRPRGPVLVDGSNVAWHGQEALAVPRPRLRPLLGLRRALRARGYFPVLLYGDATLPYTIDEPEQLREMAARGEITIVDSGVTADEVLLREAKRWNAPVVTNDYMNDWDPMGEVTKIRYTVAANGGAYLLPESG